MLPIIRYKHQRYQGGLLMSNYIGMYIKNKKWFKMKMETIISFYGKGNEIISWPSLYVGLCLVLNDNYCCMHYHCRSMLHQICMSHISNDNVCQGSKTVFSDDNIHSSSCVVGERWETFLYTWAPLFNAITAMVFQNVSWVTMHLLSHK